MESEIAQLKKEIEQLKKEKKQLEKENNKLKRRYVPDDKNSQSTFIIECEEDSDNYIIKTKCTNDPMWNVKTEDNMIIVKYLPCADVFDYHIRDSLNKMTLGFGGHKCSDHKYIIPKKECTYDDLGFTLTWNCGATLIELGWLSKYGSSISLE